MKTDIEIAQSVEMKPIAEIAASLGIDEKYVEFYGKYKAKIDPACIDGSKKDGKLILVTAITPTPAGEGKTTTTCGLADGLKKIGKKVVVALREPSLGPVFGKKGGAAGGGYAQVVPMEDINLHFTGDIHAMGAANNLLAAMIDNHIYQGNTLGIDPEKITWKRCVDMNDRQLRFIRDGIGGKTGGVPRDDGFDITVASEVMAVLCLATSITDLKNRLGRIVIGYTYEGKPVTAGDLKAAGAMTALLKDALKPNLVQTLEHTPAFIHGGPFANIAHGCNSVSATQLALKLGDYVVTEAGFGEDGRIKSAVGIGALLADGIGDTIRVSNLKAKSLLVSFWGSWCRPCRESHPELRKVFRTYRYRGFDIYSVALERSLDDWKNTIREDRLIWVNHVSELNYMDSKVARQLGIDAVPFNLLIDENRVVLAKNLTPAELDAKLDELLE